MRADVREGVDTGVKVHRPVGEEVHEAGIRFMYIEVISFYECGRC